MTSGDDIHDIVMGCPEKVIEQIAMRQNPKVEIDKNPVQHHFELEEGRKKGTKTKRMRHDRSDVEK